MKKSLKQALLSTAVLSLLVYSGTATVNAAYELSSEVAKPSASLMRAAEIGLRTHENAALQQLPNKDAIVVMSFGTTIKDTRDKTITAIVNKLQAEHPDTKVVTAFSSHIIVDRIFKKEGIKYPTPEEAMDQLKAEGYTRVAIASFDVIPGMEYNYKAAVYNEYKDQFKKLTLGMPAMYWMGQEEQEDHVAEFVEALKAQLPATNKKQAVLLMAHGTPDPANAYYAVIQDRIEYAGLKNVHLFTVEGFPRLEHLIPQLKIHGINEVTLVPMMMVAGDHALNDMAGDEPDSYKSVLLKEGFKVNTYLKGLGENPAIQQLYVDRANEAWNALQQEMKEEPKEEVKHEMPHKMNHEMKQ